MKQYDFPALEYLYYIDTDSYDMLVREGYSVEMLCQKEPVWRMASECYMREICLGQGFNCLRKIPLETAREYLTDWGLDPELAQAFEDPWC